MKTGIELIAQERKEQIEKHGIAIMEDVQNNDYGQLLVAAHWILPTNDINYEECNPFFEEELMKQIPDDWNEGVWAHMVSKTRKERMIIAGALIAAELDRMIAMEAFAEIGKLDPEVK